MKTTFKCFRCNADSGNTSKVPSHWGRAISNSRIVLCSSCRFSNIGETRQQHEARVIAEGKGSMGLERVWPLMIGQLVTALNHDLEKRNAAALWNHIVSDVKSRGESVTVNGVEI